MCLALCFPAVFESLPGAMRTVGTSPFHWKWKMLALLKRMVASGDPRCRVVCGSPQGVNLFTILPGERATSAQATSTAYPPNPQHVEVATSEASKKAAKNVQDYGSISLTAVSTHRNEQSGTTVAGASWPLLSKQHQKKDHTGTVAQLSTQHASQCPNVQVHCSIVERI